MKNIKMISSKKIGKEKPASAFEHILLLVAIGLGIYICTLI